MTAATITGLGTALPDTRLTNADLEARLDTSDAWIMARTGIRERRVAAPTETSGRSATLPCRKFVRWPSRTRGSFPTTSAS